MQTGSLAIVPCSRTLARFVRVSSNQYPLTPHLSPQPKEILSTTTIRHKCVPPPIRHSAYHQHKSIIITIIIKSCRLPPPACVRSHTHTHTNRHISRIRTGEPMSIACAPAARRNRATPQQLHTHTHSHAHEHDLYTFLLSLAHATGDVRHRNRNAVPLPRLLAESVDIGPRSQTVAATLNRAL